MLNYLRLGLLEVFGQMGFPFDALVVLATDVIDKNSCFVRVVESPRVLEDLLAITIEYDHDWAILFRVIALNVRA